MLKGGDSFGKLFSVKTLLLVKTVEKSLKTFSRMSREASSPRGISFPGTRLKTRSSRGRTLKSAEMTHTQCTRTCSPVANSGSVQQEQGRVHLQRVLGEAYSPGYTHPGYPGGI